MHGRSWLALHETCYYPIYVLQKPGLVTITRSSRGHSESAQILVTPSQYETQEVDLGNIPQANPSSEDRRTAAREDAELARVWKHREGPASFTLPLGAPLRPMPKGRDFGANRIFNGKPAGQPHMGADYTAPQGSDVPGRRGRDGCARRRPVLRRQRRIHRPRERTDQHVLPPLEG